MTVIEQLKALHEELQKQADDLNKELAPLQKEYDGLAVKINKLDTLQRPLGEQLKAKKLELNSIGKQLRGLNISLSSFQEPQEVTEGQGQVAEGYENAEPVPEENLV